MQEDFFTELFERRGDPDRFGAGSKPQQTDSQKDKDEDTKPAND